MKKFPTALIPVLALIAGGLTAAVISRSLSSGNDASDDSDARPVPAQNFFAQQQPAAVTPQNNLVPEPQPAPIIGNNPVAAHIENLGNREFGKRRQAEVALTQIGKEALPQLQQAAKSHRDEEVRLRSQKIADKINGVAVAAADGQGAAGAPLQANGPTDEDLEKLRRSLRGMMLQDQATRKTMTADQLTREQLMELWFERHPQKAAAGLVQTAPADDFSLDLTGSVGIKLGEANDGLRITSVKGGSAAALAGIKSGDLITQINGRQMNRLEDAKDLFNNTPPSTPLKVELNRRDDSLTVTIPAR